MLTYISDQAHLDPDLTFQTMWARVAACFAFALITVKVSFVLAQPAGQQFVTGDQIPTGPKIIEPELVSTHTLYEQLFQRTDDLNEDLSVGVRTIRGIRLANTFHLRTTPRGNYIDVIEISALLGGQLAWDGAVLSGWFGQEHRRIHFDSQTLRLTLNHTVNQLEEKDIFIEDGFLFAHIDLLQVILDIEVTLDLPKLDIVLGGRPTAAEQIILRERARRGLHRDNDLASGQVEVDFPRWDIPASGRLDIITSGEYRSARSTNVRQKTRKTARIHSTAHFDFANARMKIVATGDSTTSLKDVRLSAHRKHYEEHSAYSLLEIGDITGYSAVNGARAERGTGLKISNHPFFLPTIVGYETVTGDAPPEWEVELYRGATLIDFTRADSSGRFSFAPTNLKSGLNVFTIKIFGPDGQTRTEERKVLANHGVPARGRTRYQVSALQTNKTIAGVHERTRCRIPTSCSSLDSKDTLVGNISHAITNQTAVNFSQSRMHQQSGAADFSSLGLLTNLAGRQVKVDITKASGVAGGHALRLYNRLLFGRMSGSITHSEFQRFTGPAAVRNNFFLQRRSNVFMNFPSVKFGSSDAPVKMTNMARLDTYTGTAGEYSRSLTLRQSFTRKRTFISSALTGTSTSGQRYKHASNATLSATQYLKRDEVYGRATFGIKPENRLDEVSLGRRFRFQSDHTTTLEMNHRPRARAKTRLKLGLTAERQRYRVGLSSEIDTRGDYRVSFTLASSLVRTKTRPKSVSWLNEREARGAHVIVNPFLDENGNGVQDDGERLLPNSIININPPARRITHTKDRKPLFEALPTDRPVTVIIEPKSDEHPFLSAPHVRHDLVLRDGMIQTLNVAVRPAGEIAGRVLLRSTDKQGETVDRPLPQIPLEFLNADGTVIARGRTIYDGSFVVSNIPFGEVIVRPPPDYMAKSGLSVLGTAGGYDVTLARDTVWVDDLEILIGRR